PRPPPAPTRPRCARCWPTARSRSTIQTLVRAEGDQRPLRTFLNQPAQQGRTAQQQLRRFFGTTSGRKIHYGRVLVEALDPDRVPAPLDGLLAAL
ncbi:hypothetical protein ABZ372_07160, partial [Streptomyces sp. NPDC005921]